ncbi:MAG: glycerol-3-phosphate acyltransferase [Bacteroidaceae bacterium]|nr:glycerol-3-phosphate acyltransferase [Bacteroidaceae bacterium]
MDYAAAALMGYAIGSIHPSYIMTRIIKKADIRTLGSGNSGASNTVGVLGWKFGILVALLDIFKAAAAILLIKHFFSESATTEKIALLLYITGLFAIIGHNHPFYMRFRGGKGTASLIGMLFAIDIRIALLCGLLLILITVITDYIALGSLGAVLLTVILTAVFGYSIGCVAVVVIIAAMSFIKHRTNIIRITSGKEGGLREALKMK